MRSDVQHEGGQGAAYDSVRSLVGELVSKVSVQDGSTMMLQSGRFESLPLRPENFVEIDAETAPRRAAYIDGGNMELLRATNYTIEINRLYFSMFEGRRRVRPGALRPGTEFFSYVVSRVQHGDRPEIFYDTDLFPYRPEDRGMLPPSQDVSFSSTDRTLAVGGTRAAIDSVSSVARRFSEKNLACRIVEDELSEGDMLVLDGSLQDSYTNEAKYSERLYDAGLRKGVIICGLSKTSSLFTDTGASLLGSIRGISERAGLGRWYIPVAVPKGGARAVIFVVRLHPQSEHVFRFEMLADQYDALGARRAAGVFSSLAANSGDLAMLGYPYGMIDADTHARVRTASREFYRSIILSEMSRHPEWKSIMAHSKTHITHDDLNMAVG